MPKKIRLQMSATPFRVNSHRLFAWRGRVFVRLTPHEGSVINRLFLVDTGAPLSVVPYSLWHGTGLAWTSLGSRVTDDGGQPLPGFLNWFGIPCEIGQAEGELFDGQVSAGPFLIVAKFPQAPHRHPVIETTPILGLNFLSDNSPHLSLRRVRRDLSGYFQVRR